MIYYRQQHNNYILDNDNLKKYFGYLSLENVFEYLFDSISYHLLSSLLLPISNKKQVFRIVCSYAFAVLRSIGVT